MLGRLRNLFKRSVAAPPFRRAFEAASGRRFEHTPPFGRIGTETLAAVGRVRARARHVVANDALASNAAAIYTTQLVGAGIVGASEHPDPDTAARIDEAFAEWSAETGWPALQAAAVRAMAVDGEALGIMRATDDGLEVRHVPAEMLAESETRDLRNGGYVAGGVEHNADDRRVAYHIHRARPLDMFADYGRPVRLDAADVLHVFRPLGAGQFRGMSWFASVLLDVNELGQLLDALRVGAKVAAMHAGFLTDTLGTASEPFAGTVEDDILNVSLEPGVVRRLPPGFDIKFNSPQQAQQTVEFAALSIRQIAAGLQIPEFMLSGDMRGANYSSMRSALVQWRQHLEAIQHLILVPQLLTPVFRRWLTLEVYSGRLDFPDFEANRRDYFKVEWYPPAMPWVDPAKDADATAAMIAAGLKSRRQAVAELGYSVERLDREIAADRARETTLGLTFGRLENKEGTNDAA